MLDVGLVWDATTTIQRARLFEPYDLFWIEEPLHAGRSRRLRARSAGTSCQRLAAGEEECTFARLPAADRRGRHRPRPDRPDPLRPHPGAEDRRVRPAARHPGRQPQLHHRHQHRGLAALPGRGPERARARVLRRALGDQPGAGARTRSSSRTAACAVPEEPGLGVEPNMEIVEKLSRARLRIGRGPTSRAVGVEPSPQ